MSVLFFSSDKVRERLVYFWRELVPLARKEIVLPEKRKRNTSCYLCKWIAPFYMELLM
jgi:hypothetical protein